MPIKVGQVWASTQAPFPRRDASDWSCPEPMVAAAVAAKGPAQIEIYGQVSVQWQEPPGPAVDTGADQVGRQRIGATTGGSQAAVRGVDVHHSLWTGRQIASVAGAGQIGGAEMQHRHLARLGQPEAQPPTSTV